MINYNDHKSTTLRWVFFLLSIVWTQTGHMQNAKGGADTVDEKTTYETRNPVFSFDKPAGQPAKLNLRKVPDSLVNALKNDEDFWYASKAFNKMPAKTEEQGKPAEIPFFLQPWFKTLLWIFIIGAVVAVFIWYLAVSNVRMFRKPSRPVDAEGPVTDHQDIFSINYEKELARSLAAKDHRQAIRLLYLQTLKVLTEKNMIHYKVDYTNRDYLQQLGPTDYYSDFFRLTRNFDYIWYGMFDISEPAFQIVQQDFNSFKNRLQQ